MKYVYVYSYANLTGIHKMKVSKVQEETELTVVCDDGAKFVKANAGKPIVEPFCEGSLEFAYTAFYFEPSENAFNDLILNLLTVHRADYERAAKQAAENISILRSDKIKKAKEEIEKMGE